jgi:pimeloyl-ACP methyl ester carboxylesterase
MAVPHMAAFAWAKANDPDQMYKSRYIGRFQWPILPEMSLAKDDFKTLRNLWSLCPKEEVEDYLTIFGTKEGRTGPINWYRANKTNPDDPKSEMKFTDVYLPTLLIWGNTDLAIARAGVERSKQYMKGEFKFIELDAGHWLVQEKYDEVTKEIKAHIQNHSLQA